MRHGRSYSSLLKPSSSSSSQLSDLLLVASVTKTLSLSGTRSLDPHSLPLSEPLIIQILRKPSLDPSQKLSFFRWCSASLSHFYKHSACAYSTIFRSVCTAGYLSEVPDLLISMKGDGVVVDSGTFMLLLDAFLRLGKFDSALQILDHMEELGVTVNARMYCSVLVALIRKNQLAPALSIFYKLLDASDCSVAGVLDSIACNELLVSLKKEDMRVEFKNVFDKLMKKTGFKLDTWGYNICIHAFGCWGDLATSLSLFKEMKENSVAGPDLCTYNSLIQVLSSVGKVKDALIVWDELNVSGHEPDAFTYRIIIQGCCKAYRIDDATKIFDIDQWSSSPYLDHLANQVKSTDSSSRLFLLSRGQRVQANRTGSFDIDMVNTFLSMFLSKGKLSLACKLFEIFTDMGVNPVGYTYNSMMSSFVKKGYFNQAWGVLSEMVEKICPADMATYNVMIQGLGKMGRADLASIVVDKLMKQGGHLDIVMYNTLINELGKAGRIDEANELFNQMKGSGINPDVVTFNTMIEVHSKAGRLKEAHKFLKMMLDSGCLSNHVTDTTLDFLGKEIEKTRYQKASMKRNKDGES